MIPCNLSSHSEHTTNVLMLKYRCLALLFVLHKRTDDGLVKPKHVAHASD